MNDYDILIAGAGFSGLAAALKLSRAGKSVAVAEAREEAGGRVRIRQSDGWPVHLGAEFVHGHLDTTFRLLKEAGLEAEPVTGDDWSFRTGRLLREGFGDNGWGQVIEKLLQLEEDMPLSRFLQANFAGPEFADTVASITGFAEGYDAADLSRLSAFSFRNDLTAGEEQQYRIRGGYGPLLDHMVKECRKAGTDFYFGSRITRVTRSDRDALSCRTAEGALFSSRHLLLTFPLTVLAREPEFVPPIPGLAEALGKTGTGDVIKCIFRFKRPFWENVAPGLGFVFSGEAVPTWWTQSPLPVPILTGWLAGPSATRLSGLADQELLSIAKRSLAAIFTLSSDALSELLEDEYVCNWAAEEFARGAYSYTTVTTAEAVAFLQKGVDGQIWFAGEGVYSGVHTGTVEAGLVSGEEAAERILSQESQPVTD
jgi:monoamine oxidase